MAGFRGMQGAGVKSGLGRRCPRAAFAAWLPLLLGLWLAPSTAQAQCTPDPAASGQTVTCPTGTTDPDGFQATTDNVTVKVQPSATVNDNGFAAISINNDSSVINNG